MRIIGYEPVYKIMVKGDVLGRTTNYDDALYFASITRGAKIIKTTQPIFKTE